jgi:hypothetical protein
MKAASVLDGSIKVQMNPLQLRKAGAIIENMQEATSRFSRGLVTIWRADTPTAQAGYSDEDINHVCRALFLDQDPHSLLVSTFSLHGIP